VLALDKIPNNHARHPPFIPPNSKRKTTTNEPRLILCLLLEFLADPSWAGRCGGSISYADERFVSQNTGGQDGFLSSIKCGMSIFLGGGEYTLKRGVYGIGYMRTYFPIVYSRFFSHKLIDA
jgi:hypothetical protein